MVERYSVVLPFVVQSSVVLPSVVQSSVVLPSVVQKVWGLALLPSEA
jgi:hypothetical protein